MNKTRHQLTITESCAGQRLDRALSVLLPDFSRSALADACEKGLVQVNGIVRAKKYGVSLGDVITADIPDPVAYEARAQDIPLDIVYMDKDLAVVNKPKGMVVHPAPGNPDGTLVNALLSVCAGELSGINGVMRPGIVHRIDKDTSGLLVAAKTNKAHLSLARQLKDHSMTRIYHALVLGNPDEEGMVEAPIGRSAGDRKKMAVTEKNAKPALTRYRVLERFSGYSYIECRLETGRTHQIRVHMAHIGHPLAGDCIYGVKKEKLPLQGQCLHAKVLGFDHPETGEHMVFDGGLPEYFERVLTILRTGV